MGKLLDKLFHRNTVDIVDTDPYRLCKECIKFGTLSCPNSFHCFARDDKPYFENKNKKSLTKIEKGI